MMRALVVYESMFGNAQAVASAIAQGVATQMAVDVVEVGNAPTAIAPDVDLLIVGGPTHQLGLSRPASRKEAAKQAERPLVSARIGLREWLEALEQNSGETVAAAFATRLTKPRWLRFLGSAEGHIEKPLLKLRFQMAAPGKHFFVEGTRGPLQGGELQRARQWGEQVARNVAVSATEQHAA